ncbi:MAG: hypothetical protein ACSNEK_02165 [Parachlamydiaceae bacterium]
MDFQGINSYEHKMTTRYAKTMDRLLEKSSVARLLPFGPGMTLIRIADKINQVAQAYFKGLVNLCGAPISSHCNFKIGLSQLAFQVTQKSFDLIFEAFTAPLDAITKQASFTCGGRSFTQDILFALNVKENSSPDFSLIDLQ